MYLSDIRFPELLSILPKGGVGAEIGVLKGEFSSLLLQDCQPRLLHLIDPWIEQSGDYGFDLSNARQSEQNERYRHVCNLFSEEISSQKVVVHRAFSDVAANRFPPDYFDWLYIDGNHTYEAVMTDLMSYAPKMKDTGLIMGDDFINSPYYQEMKFGVVEAVEDFVKNEGYELVLLTQDWRFIISKPDNPVLKDFLQSLFLLANYVVEVEKLEYKKYRTKVAPLPDGKFRIFHSFT